MPMTNRDQYAARRPSRVLVTALNGAVTLAVAAVAGQSIYVVGLVTMVSGGAGFCGLTENAGGGATLVHFPPNQTMQVGDGLPYLLKTTAGAALYVDNLPGTVGNYVTLYYYQF